MKTFTAWFREHRFSTHGLALAIGSLAILVETDARLREVLLKDLNLHPKIISTLACLGAILLAYKQPKKTEPPESPAEDDTKPTPV